MSRITAVAGNQLSSRLITIGVHTQIVVDGFTHQQDGTGNRIIRGAGHHFIMAAGIRIIVLDGFGFLVQRGDRLG